MTTFTINDPIFAPMRETPGASPTALKNLVDALNNNPYANATFTLAVQRGDVVFELLDHAEMEKNNAGAFFSNDRGSKAFALRANKFAIQLDKDWFVPNGANEATFAQSQGARNALGVLIHEADHSNHQALYDEAYKLSSTPSYRPELTGAARVAASVDLTMKAEVAGWYADLNTLRTELKSGRISQFQFDVHTHPERNIAGKLLAVEAQGKALGFSGDALTKYVMDHGQKALPSDYVDRYSTAYAPSVDPREVRKHLAYSLDDPTGIKSFAEEVGPDGSYVSSATYNNGDRITMVDTGLSCRVTETDGARDNADYATRTTAYDAQGRQEAIDTVMDDGTRGETRWDLSGSQSWAALVAHYDARGRNDATNVYSDDGTSTTYAHDVNGAQSWSVLQTHYDAKGRNDATNVWMDDGTLSVTTTDVSDSQSWAVLVAHYDAQGRNDATNTYLDGGSLSVSSTDVNGSHPWAFIETHYEQGRVDWSSTSMDDGSRHWTDINQSDQPGWTHLTSRFDAAGREDYANLHLTGGGRLEYDYDQDGSHAYNRIETRYDASGHRTSATRYIDDGASVCIQFDHYAPGQDRVQVFNAAGQSIYVGCQVKGFLVTIAGYWTPAYGDGMGVQGFLPGSRGYQTGPSSIPQPFPDYDPYPNARGEVGPITPADHW